MGLGDITKTLALSAALLYNTDALAQGQRISPITPISIKMPDSIVQTLEEKTVVDPSYQNILREINILQQESVWNGTRFKPSNYSPWQIGQKLTPQIRQAIDRFDVGKKYEVVNAFTYGGEVVVEVEFEQPEKSHFTETEYVVLTPLKISFPELETVKFTSTGSGDKDTEFKGYRRTGRSIEQTLEPGTFKKGTQKTKDNDQRAISSTLKEIRDEAALIQRHPPLDYKIPQNLSRQEENAIYRQYAGRDMYINRKAHDLYDDIAELCSIQTPGRYGPNQFTLIRGGALKIDLNTLRFSGDLGHWQDIGDAIYIAPDMTATLVYSNRDCKTETKLSKCNFKP